MWLEPAKTGKILKTKITKQWKHCLVSVNSMNFKSEYCYSSSSGPYYHNLLGNRATKKESKDISTTV